MRISPEKLIAEAETTGFRADVLEKAIHLMGLLDSIRSHPFLKGKLALKGGTALNLFVFDVPRLSVDIDLNYVGAESREVMLGERPRIEEALQAVFSREDFYVRRMPEEHAGGKWSLRYPAASGQSGRVDVTSTTCTACLFGRSPRWTPALWAVGGLRISPWWTFMSSRQES